MSETTELSIKGESIQSLYGSYLKEIFLVNRRYQRKLVWTIEEKRSFIDSIVKGYPVPLILLAEVKTEKGRKLEIIDGMQRMNAIMSFIDQEFDLGDKYFNLDTMADTKFLKDSGVITQKGEALDRKICAEIVRYQIPLSVYQESGDSHIDEVFRRLNSGGRHLSKQELRQAGAVSKFASIVRKLASNIRGDSSASDVLDLNAMKNISITNRNLKYGISVENIFWVKNNIITKEALRQSQDEEVIADIVAWVSSDKGLRSSSDVLNQLYNFNTEGEDESSLFNSIELQIQKVNEEIVISNIQTVFDEIIKLVESTGKTFNALLFENQQAKISRYFQIVFYAFYKLLINEGMEISDTKKLIDLLDKAGDRTISLAAGGGNWSAKEKQTQSDALYGVIRGCFIKSNNNDPARNQWITRFENILMQSSTEQALYDFKVGLHKIEENPTALDKDTFSKIIRTLTAMANTFPGSTGYCLLGVADNKATADRHQSIYGAGYISYSSFYITGVGAEAIKYYGDIDKYFTRIVQLIREQPISERDKDNLARNITTVRYFDKDVVILKIESDEKPSVYESGYHVRHGSNNHEVKPENFSELFARFQK
ncbi:GmrSD restriction endonuclease domain-containing protein [Undibacterium sp. TC9W]|uniref:GmrSD restriction endonuclease domain-containing protein n=1 Tax=Undibacterium sp. TC9W TaxID=3413053 RepID=UPI003BF08846